MGDKSGLRIGGEVAEDDGTCEEEADDDEVSLRRSQKKTVVEKR